MPHEPLSGDALLDALSEVPGDPAEPVPARNGILWTVHPDAVKPPTAPYHGKSLWGWTPNADIPHVVSVPIEAALADLYPTPHKQPDPHPASEALIERPRVITWEPVPLAITSWRVFINPTEEENPE